MDPNILSMITMIALAVLVIIFLIRLMKIKNERDAARQEAQELKDHYEYEMHKAEIVSLQSQINPHFLYNTLEVIRSEALINNDPVSAQMAETLANYFRYNISRRDDVVSLGDELDNVDNYIKIQKKRFGSRISYEVIYHTDKAEARGAQIPKLSLQPLVENAIVHGIEQLVSGGLVLVHVTVTEKRLIITVEDNGVGMNSEDLEKLNEHISQNTRIEKKDSKHGGLALVNVNKRIKMMYGDSYGLTYYSAPGIGTEAEITMPFIQG